MNRSANIQAVDKYVYELLHKDSSGHDHLHCKRVYELACKLQSLEGGNLELIAVAAYLHDVDDEKISPETASSNYNARNILDKLQLDNEQKNIVLEIINSVSFSKNKKPASLEGRIVQDADRLDAIGAVGIARCFAYGGNKNRPMYYESDLENNDMSESNSSFAHFYNKLLLLENKMNTESAKYIARERTKFLKLFLTNFRNEIGIDV